MTLFRGFGERPAAHGVAGAEDLARRGATHRRRRVLGHAARVCRDDPQRDGPVLGHVLANGRGGSRRRTMPGCERPSGSRWWTAWIPRARRRRGRRHRGPRRARPTSGPRVEATITPHGIYTVSADTLAWAAAEADARGLPVQIHFLETEDEVTGVVERYGERPGSLLDRLGVLGPRTVLAHGVWMDEPELELVAERGCDGRDEPRLEPQAGGRSDLPVSADAGARDPRRTRNRWRVVEQLARSPRRREGPGAAAEARGRTTRRRCPPTRRGPS